MRHSKQREAILNIVRNTTSHPTADWVYDQVRNHYPQVSLGTVYRNLGQLVEAKIVRAINRKGTVHYDGNISKHYHFYCTDCNKLFDIDIPVDTFLKNISQQMPHEIVHHDISFSGVCSNCQS